MRGLAIGLLWVLGCGDGEVGAGDVTAGSGASPGVGGGGVGAANGGTSSANGGAGGDASGGAGIAGGSTADRLVGDEWFASDVDDPSDAPLFGFDFFGFSQGSGDADMTVTHQLDGPLGRPFVRQDIHSTQPEFGGGWTANPLFLPSQCSWGDSFFLRFSFMPIGDFHQEQKIVILSRGDIPNDGRYILTVEDWGRGYAWRLQKDGGEDLAQFPPVDGDQFITDVDTWSHIQVEGRYSSAPGVADGEYRLWVNNNDPSAPNAERTGIVLETTTSDPNYLGWSGYHQVLSGPRSFAWTDVRVGPTFDPAWAP